MSEIFNDYKFDSNIQCWVPKKRREHFAYSDGDQTEQRLLQIIQQAKDLTSYSMELRQHINDWASRYHLSPVRANLLRPFQDQLTGDILEVGAGCGAITRFLGECGGQVTALEGSPLRGTICAHRCRDLPNVQVVVDAFHLFPAEQRYDVVTLIGVLEYARQYFPAAEGQDSIDAMLDHAQRCLKPGGILLLAIENQLGLKYFAGAGEDHLGIPMFGVENHYHEKGVVTFGRLELHKRVGKAGLSEQQWWFPFPDYKLPVALLSEQSLSPELVRQFESLLIPSLESDPQLPPHPIFMQGRVWKTLSSNGLGIELANSFMVLASNKKFVQAQQNITCAYYFSSERKPEYAKQLCFQLKENNQLEIQQRKLFPDCSAQPVVPVKMHIQPVAGFVSGILWSQRLHDILANEGWTLDQLIQWAECWFNALWKKNPLQVKSQELNSAYVVPGGLLDATPRNMLVQANGESEFIDLEWETELPLDLGFLLFRGLYLSLLDINRVALPASGTPLRAVDIFLAITHRLGFSLAETDIARFGKLESDIQVWISGRPPLHLEDILAYHLQVRMVLDLDGSVKAGWDSAIAERDRLIVERGLVIAERDRLIVERGLVIAERDNAVAVVDQMYKSASWRLTRPLRFAAWLIRNFFSRDSRINLIDGIRQHYHRLPLPASVKRAVSFFVHRIIGRKIGAWRWNSSDTLPFNFPSIKCNPSRNDYADYVFWGVIDWHFRHQRPQQLATALTKAGRRVFYISPNFVNDERSGFEVEALDETGRLFQIKLFVSGAPVIYLSAPRADIVDQLNASIGEVLVWANCAQLFSVVQHPFWFEVARILPNSRLIYDCMDHHEGFGNNASSLIQLEKALLSSADLTITTSSWLDDMVAPYTKKHVLIRNAGDYDHFSNKPKDVYRDSQDRQIIGYYGAIAEWFDLDLIEAIARQYPDCCVLLIGSDTVNAKTKLAKFQNIIFIGEVSYSQLPYYLYGIDICLLPFKIVPLTLATNPVKAYEYLSAGKPIVTVDLPEMKLFDGLIYVATDKNDFLATISKLLTQVESTELISLRMDFAQNQTWQHRAEMLMSEAESSIADPKISVIVVTYNNLDFTRTCLSSLDDYSQYEPLEIIVVDNASRDESPAFLSNWLSGRSNRKLILNEDNRGFAAANNQGLEIATGDYMVLLNNDTHVTPGWIRTLMSHLKRDATIGLIGPVTNNIGNEAKIDIDYSDMNEMLEKSGAYIRRHVGKIFPLRTVAFFCVMMSRMIYERVGPLDEVFGRGFFEDDDYCRRVEQLGLRIVCAEDVFVHHHLSASFDKLKLKERKKLFDENKKIYEAKWGKWSPHSYRGTEL